MGPPRFALVGAPVLCWAYRCPYSCCTGRIIKPPKIRAFLTAVLALVLVGGAGTGTAIAGAPAQPATVTAGVKAFDAVNPPTLSQLTCLKAQGYRLEFLDANSAFAAGYANAKSLGITVVPFQGYDPDAFRDVRMATSRANSMLAYLAAAKYPKGSQVFVDIEFNNYEGSTRAAQVKWTQTWAQTVVAAGYVAGVYVGQPNVLTTADFNEIALPAVSVYWQSQSRTAPATRQGYVARQSLQVTSSCEGYVLDPDVVGTDAYGLPLVGSEGGGTPPRISPGAAAVRSKDGRLHVFSIGTDQHLYQTAQTASGWSAPQDLGGSLAGTPAVTYSAATGRYDVFGVGANGRIYQTTYSGGRWQGLAPLPATGFVGGLSAVIATDGSYHLAGIRADHHLYQVVHSSRGWAVPENRGGTVAGTPGLTYRSGRYDIFATGTDGRIYQTYYQGGWSPVSALPASGFVGGVSAVVASDGSYHLAAVGTDRRLYQVVHNSAGWNARQSLGGGLLGSAALVFQATGGRYDAFGIGTAGALYQITYQRTWGPFQRIGNGPFV